MTTTTLTTAYQYCRDITVQHYENFPVASGLLPASIRKHVYPIYAFARYADDLADELQDKTALLDWREMLHQSVSGHASHPIFIALSDTIQKFDLPIALFDDLLKAFLQDMEKTHYRDMGELRHYCKHSANPVGRLILLLHGYRSDKLFQYSDDICTALQLTNFWQDVMIDIDKDRVYIPESYLARYNLSVDTIKNGLVDKQFRSMVAELVSETEMLFEQGRPLLSHLKKRLRWELKLTIMGGESILNKIKDVDYDVLHFHPKLSKRDWAKVVIQSIYKSSVYK